MKLSELKEFPAIEERIRRVREYRLKSKRKTTIELAKYPMLFGEIRHPN